MAGCAGGVAACQTRCLQRVAITIGLAYERHRSGMLKRARYDGRQASMHRGDVRSSGAERMRCRRAYRASTVGAIANSAGNRFAQSEPVWRAPAGSRPMASACAVIATGVAEMAAYARLFEWDDNHAKPPRQRVPVGSKPAAYAGAIIAVGATEFVAQARFFERDDQPLQGQPR